MFGRFFQAFLATGHRTHFARQADLAEHQQIMGQRAVAQAGHHGSHQRQVGGGFQHLDPAHHVEEHVLIVGRNAPMPVQDRQQHRQPVLIQAKGDAPRVGEMTVVDQRLHFDQHRPGAFPGRHDHATGDFFLGAGQKNRRRIGDFFQAFVGHAEHAQFVDRAKAVLYGTQQAQAAIGFAFEIQHGVDHVLKHARTGQRTFLCHVTDQENSGAALLGVAHQQGSTFPNLGHASRRRLQLLGEDRLD